MLRFLKPSSVFNNEICVGEYILQVCHYSNKVWMFFMNFDEFGGEQKIT